MADSLEYRVFRNLYDTLHSGIRSDVGRVVQVTFSNKLIPETIRNVAGNATGGALSDDDRTTVFLIAVQNRIKVDPVSVLRSFIAIMRQDSYTDILADKLSDELKKEVKVMAEEREAALKREQEAEEAATKERELALKKAQEEAKEAAARSVKEREMRAHAQKQMMVTSTAPVVRRTIVTGTFDASLVSPSQPLTAHSNLPWDSLLTKSSSLASLPTAGAATTPSTGISGRDLPPPNVLALSQAQSNNYPVGSYTPSMGEGFMSSSFRGASFSGPALGVPSTVTSPPLFDGALTRRAMSPVIFGTSGPSRRQSLQSTPMSFNNTRSYSGLQQLVQMSPGTNVVHHSSSSQQFHPLHPEKLQGGFSSAANPPPTALTIETLPELENNSKPANTSDQNLELKDLFSLSVGVSNRDDVAAAENVPTQPEVATSQQPVSAVSPPTTKILDGHPYPAMESQCPSETTTTTVSLQTKCPFRPSSLQDTSESTGNDVNKSETAFPKVSQTADPKIDVMAPTPQTSHPPAEVGTFPDASSTEDEESEGSTMPVFALKPPVTKRSMSSISQASTDSSQSSDYYTPPTTPGPVDNHPSSPVDDHPIQESQYLTDDDDRTKLASAIGALSLREKRQRVSEHKRHCTKCARMKRDIIGLNEEIKTLKRSLSQSKDTQDKQVSDLKEQLFNSEQDKYRLTAAMEEGRSRHAVELSKMEERHAIALNEADKRHAVATSQIASLQEQVRQLFQSNEQYQKELLCVKGEVYDYRKQAEAAQQQVQYLARELHRVNSLQCDVIDYGEHQIQTQEQITYSENAPYTL